MKLTPIQITEAGPGIDLSNLPDGLSVRMSDPVKDFAYARNAVTLTYDLSGYVNVRLSFAALEYGDEPHEPPPSPFGDDAQFDGVAVSADGTNWYEVQDLRHLRSDRFTACNVDLDAALAQWGLSYGRAFKIRFCQYDNNPAPMDGIFLRRIELTAELRAPAFHLPMNDSAASPTVHDAAPGGRDQVFLDPAGNPNTTAHSVPGPHGQTALAFDGVDDRIDFGPTLLGDIVAANRDFTLSFWYKSADPGATSKTFLRRAGAYTEPHTRNYVSNGRISWEVAWAGGSASLSSATGMLNGQWRHVVCRRQGQILTLWGDGAVQQTRTHADYVNSLFCSSWSSRAIGQTYGTNLSDWPFAMADLRVYDRAIRDEEIVALSR
jgi:hypothetical protein